MNKAMISMAILAGTISDSVDRSDHRTARVHKFVSEQQRKNAKRKSEKKRRKRRSVQG